MKDLLKIRVKALLLIAILLISVVGGLSAKKIAIIDAGSSGSRLYVYDIDDTTRKLTVVYPTAAQVEKSKGAALSKITVTETEVVQFMNNMTGKYDGKESEVIDLYVLATAGMRLDPAKKDIYRLMMLKKSYSRFNLVNAMTISGKYEGLYAWIAANYNNGWLTYSSGSWSLNDTYGILEIGGASMQIAFNVPDYDPSNCINHSRFGYIYSKSYLGGGADQVFKNYDSMKQNKFGVALDVNLKAKIGQLTKFVRLGRPINYAIDNAGVDSKAALLAYAERISVPDSVGNHHPKMNAEYIAYIFETWGLDRKTIRAVVESDWTLGAALDIVVNNQQPEAFNYDPTNPN